MLYYIHRVMLDNVIGYINEQVCSGNSNLCYFSQNAEGTVRLQVGF